MPLFSANRIGYDVFTNGKDCKLRDKLISLGDVIFFSDRKGNVIWPVEAYNVLTQDDMKRCADLFVSMSKGAFHL